MDDKQDEVAAARPDIDERTLQLVSKGRWNVPGYKVWFAYCEFYNRDGFANIIAGEIR